MPKIASAVLVIIFLFLIYVGITFNKATNNPLNFNSQDLQNQNPTLTPTSTPTPTPTTNSNVTVYYQGINSPKGIGFFDNTLYVGSQSDNALYKIKDGTLSKITDQGYPTSMTFDKNGDITATFTNDNKLNLIKSDGTIENLNTGRLNGPYGLILDKDKNFYISNYYGNNVVELPQGNQNNEPKVIVSGLSNPAGMFYNQSNNSLYIANNTNSQITIYNLGSGNRQDFTVKDINWLNSIYVTSDDRILVTGVFGQSGVVAQVNNTGNYKLLAVTNLPNPIMGYFDSDSSIYLVSPNDLANRVLRATF